MSLSVGLYFIRKMAKCRRECLGEGGRCFATLREEVCLSGGVDQEGGGEAFE